MSYDLVINYTKKVEQIIKIKGGKGKGLHSLLSSVECNIKPNVVKSIRFIATIRNKYLHEDNFILTDNLKTEFVNEYKLIIHELDFEKENEIINYEYCQKCEINTATNVSEIKEEEFDSDTCQLVQYTYKIIKCSHCNNEISRDFKGIIGM